MKILVMSGVSRSMTNSMEHCNLVLGKLIRGKKERYNPHRKKGGFNNSRSFDSNLWNENPQITEEE